MLILPNILSDAEYELNPLCSRPQKCQPEIQYVTRTETVPEYVTTTHYQTHTQYQTQVSSHSVPCSFKCSIPMPSAGV